MPKSLAILETGTFLLRAARISFFLLTTSAADLLSRLPLPLVVVGAGEPNTFLAISAKVFRRVRSLFCQLHIEYPEGSSASGDGAAPAETLRSPIDSTRSNFSAKRLNPTPHYFVS
jgi:hypothetical protein